MLKNRFFLRSMVVIAICLAGVFMFVSCKKQSDEKQITSFSFTVPPAVGVINESAKTIAVTVPEGTDVTALSPVIVVSSLATVVPYSGVPQNFTYPVTYMVSAENGSAVNYVVTVTIDGDNGGGGGGGGEGNTLSGSMWENRTLTKGEYIVEGDFRIEGNALLTIEAGVEIRFSSTNGAITVTNNAGMTMNGTASEPVKILGPIDNTNKGSWNRIQYNSNRADNIMNYVHLSLGGSGSYAYSAMVEVGAGMLKMNNCIIDGSAKNGIVVSGDATLTEFNNNEIKNCNENPVYANSNVMAVKNVNGTNSFTGNVKNYIYVGKETIGETMTLNRLSIPWFFDNGLYVNDNSTPVTLTIEAGTSLFFNSDKRLEVDKNGILVAEGTASNRIIIRGETNQPGYWKGIYIKSEQNGNKLNYCDISGSGMGSSYDKNSNLYLDPTGDKMRLQVLNTTLTGSGFYGLGVEGDKSKFDQVDWQNVTFGTCSGGNVWHYNTGKIYNSFEEFLED